MAVLAAEGAVVAVAVLVLVAAIELVGLLCSASTRRTVNPGSILCISVGLLNITVSLLIANYAAALEVLPEIFIIDIHTFRCRLIVSLVLVWVS